MSAPEVKIRKARREDCKEIMRLIKELADFEKMSDQVKIDASVLEKDGFDSEHPPVKCLVVEDPGNTEGGACKLIGYAQYCLTYGTWDGKRIWLEDIMISDNYKGRGIGKKLFAAVCKEAQSLGAVTMRYVVLSWNPAKEFYKKLGAENLTEKEDWQYYGIKLPDIKKIAESI